VFEILAPLGKGGMGEVYRARDTKLGRDVAIKLLPEALSTDPGRLARFRREAHVLASLNHQNVASIYGLEEADGNPFLVLELALGEDLSERIGRGPISLDDALGISRKITDGIEAAHEKGIVHRDLKPANIKVTDEGDVKVLDFGLARAFEGDTSEGTAGDVSQSPTMSAQATQAGVILGTAAYMSPEQAKGKVVDKRADTWAFGVVLFEMLSGRRLFTGETASEILASVIKDEPDWRSLPGATPASVLRLLQRCLVKDPRDRLRDIGEARIAIDRQLSAPQDREQDDESSASLLKRSLPWVLTAVTMIALVFSLFQTRLSDPAADAQVTRLRVEVAPDGALLLDEGPAVVLSPDGRWMAYVAKSEERQQLYIRSLDQQQARPLIGTEGARNPFFSPDGQWVGFFVEGALKKVTVGGGSPLTICETGMSRGGTWGPGDTIVFAPDITSGLSRVSASGGPVSTVTAIHDEIRSHRWPQFLPDGRRVVYTAQRLGLNYDESDILIVDLESGESKTVHRGGTHPRVLPTGHLTFAHAGSLFSAPLDLGRLETTAQPISVLEQLYHDNGKGGAQYAFSDTGDLAYFEGAFVDRVLTLLWVDRAGGITVSTLERGSVAYYAITLSPDGSRAALKLEREANPDIWVVDLERDVSLRLTVDPSDDSAPIWTRDGSRITFSSRREGSANLYWMASDGSEEPQLLLRSPDHKIPTSWGSTGSGVLAFQQLSADGDWDLWTLALDDHGDPTPPEPFLATRFHESQANFSPDGRFIAYDSNEAGRFEIYVRPFSGEGGKWQVSSAGGRFPRWSPAGSELFYRNDNKMMVVPYRSEAGSFRAERPRELFEKVFHRSPLYGAYDVAPDGRRFLMIGLGDPSRPTEVDGTHINIVLNWFDEIESLVPTH